MTSALRNEGNLLKKSAGLWGVLGLCLTACSRPDPQAKNVGSTSDGPPPAAEATAGVPTPAAPTTKWLEQGWSEEVRSRFHHTTQGSATFPVPYEWFIALEQPSATPAAPSGLLSDLQYLASLGFIVDDAKGSSSGKMPVGFTNTPDFDNPIGDALGQNPVTGQRYGAIGFNCAACHTRQLEYKGSRLLIDGGPALIDLNQFRTALKQSLGGLTDDTRRGRFMARVLGASPKPEQMQALGAQIKGFLGGVQAEGVAEQRAVKAAGGEFAEGFSRLDALARIGNEIFWSQQRDATGVQGPELDGNYAATNAPVDFPPIWTAPWFDWVQYNGSIMQPMFRNFAEALGVGAVVNVGSGARHLDSTVRVKNLFDLEHALTGAPPLPNKRFEGLTAPRWPEDTLGPIDKQLAAKGDVLYRKHCQSCHLPPVSSDEFWSDEHWASDAEAYARSERKQYEYLRLPLIPLDRIGTDPMQAKNFASRKIKLPASLGGKVVSYADALKKLSPAIEKAYDAEKVPKNERAELDGNRPNEFRDELAYRPRPLNGVWATAPYLHNASVPSLYHMLTPASERPPVLYLGSRELDPKHVGVGYQGSPESSFKLDTSTLGNQNTGHEFADGQGKGIIGPKLSEDERFALIEYLKTL